MFGISVSPPLSAMSAQGAECRAEETIQHNGLKDRTKNGFVQLSLCKASRDSIPWRMMPCERFSATRLKIILL